MNIRTLINKYQEFLRFGIVGVLATAIHYGIYYALQLVVNINIAYTCGYAISFICNFLLTSYFTFRTRPSVKKGVGFVFSHLVNYTLQIVTLNVFVYLGVPSAIVPVPVFAIAIPVNFLLVRFVFKNLDKK